VGVGRDKKESKGRTQRRGTRGRNGRGKTKDEWKKRIRGRIQGRKREEMGRKKALMPYEQSREGGRPRTSGILPLTGDASKQPDWSFEAGGGKEKEPDRKKKKQKKIKNQCGFHQKVNPPEWQKNARGKTNPEGSKRGKGENEYDTDQ